MRAATRRTQKYKDKVGGQVLPGQKERFGSKIGKQVEIEEIVKANAELLGISLLELPYYIIFGKECQRVKDTHSAELCGDEVCILENKWTERGLTRTTLASIEGLLDVPGCPVAPPCPEDWCDEDWTRRKQLTIDNTNVDAILNNFPVLVSITDTGLRDYAKADGSDILFCDEGFEKYDREIVYWNKPTGQLICWVRIPQVLNTQPTNFWMYYGNAAGAETNSTATWNANFCMVQHMHQASALLLDDSTANGNDVTVENGNPTYQQGGKIYRSVDFDGTLDEVDVPHDASLNFTGMGANFSVSIWTYPTASTGPGAALIKGTGDATAWRLLAWAAGAGITMTGKIMGAECEGTGEIPLNTWTLITMTYDGNNARIYANDVLKVTTPIGAKNPDTVSSLDIGACHYEANLEYTGRIEEVRTEKGERPIAWIKACYHNQNAPGTFVTVGSEETCGI